MQEYIGGDRMFWYVLISCFVLANPFLNVSCIFSAFGIREERQSSIQCHMLNDASTYRLWKYLYHG